MKYPTLIIASILFISFLGNVTFGTEDTPKPNIIFFLVDDLGWSDVGCYGSKFHETPNIDQLAKEGMRFDNAYATCHVCSPSRASILTGKYPARTNLTEWLGGRPERNYEKLHSAKKLMSLPDDEITLAETLKKHGYATANYGKAHLRKDPKTYGFDEAITGWVRSYYYPFSPQYTKTLPSKKATIIPINLPMLRSTSLNETRTGPSLSIWNTLLFTIRFRAARTSLKSTEKN